MKSEKLPQLGIKEMRGIARDALLMSPERGWNRTFSNHSMYIMRLRYKFSFSKI